MKLSQNNSALRVCVDSVAGGQIGGRVYGQRLTEPLLFADIGDLLLQIDAVLNSQDYPRAFQRKRSFGAGEKETPPADKEFGGNFMSKETVEASQGEIGTHILNIFMRQNTSWQGSIDWLDGSPSRGFRSALEYIRLVNEALKKA
jgi:hypothetical protein